MGLNVGKSNTDHTDLRRMGCLIWEFYGKKKLKLNANQLKMDKSFFEKRMGEFFGCFFF